MHVCMQAVCLFTNNTVGYCTLDLKDQKTPTSGTGIISHCSHQSDVRTLAFSSDTTAILSASSESLKVWNRYSAHVLISIFSIIFFKNSCHILTDWSDFVKQNTLLSLISVPFCELISSITFYCILSYKIVQQKIYAQ